MPAKQEANGTAGAAGAAAAASTADTDAERERKRLERCASWRQFGACVSVQTLHFMTGVCMAYSSSLIPALEDPETSEIPLDSEHRMGAWLASTFVLSVPVGALVSMLLNDKLGRVALIKSACAPFCLGWVLIATAQSFAMLVVGRLLTGIAIGLAHSPSLLFCAEVANKNIRGGLSAMATGFASMAIVACYGMGAAMHWRTHAWANCAVFAVPLTLQTLFSMESPVWLKARARDEAAAASSLYYYNDPDVVLSGPSSASSPGKEEAVWRKFKPLFCRPSGYKPLVLNATVFALQQLVGVYITIYYAVTFLQETKSSLDPYLATICIGLVRLVGCTGTSLVMTRFGRRPLMLVSSVGQAVCMLVSGYATHLILQEEGSASSWWVVMGLLGYIALGCLGWQVVPWSMMAELFPHQVRGLAQPLNSATAHILMFAMLQAYPVISELVGGAAGIQFLFAAFSVLGGVFVFVFLPETRGRTLQEIEDYFQNNVVYVTERRRRRAARREAAVAAITSKQAVVPAV
ncbi:Facilitated trehalose transporter Tret1 [Frankliniella fusca]|uniref:Facilitated trehalose transporter Tret1 n=1 Tax=Frankliniella fusca TaxID=407009 RepID=A0AAE1HM74_9NEOP|nr:Facilitated trehalose transporter Tret1 [Frankliniella fusca]